MSRPCRTNIPGSSHIGCRAPTCSARLWSNYERSGLGGEESAILAFNGCHNELKEAIKRAAELDQALTDPPFTT